MDLTLHRQNCGYMVGDTGLLVMEEDGQWGFLCGMYLHASIGTPIQRWLDRHQLLSLRFSRRLDAIEYLRAVLDTDPPSDWTWVRSLDIRWDRVHNLYRASVDGKNWYLCRAARGWTWHDSPDPGSPVVVLARSLWEAQHMQGLFLIVAAGSA